MISTLFKEIFFRKSNSLISVTLLLAASALVTIAVIMFSSWSRKSEELLLKKQAKVEQTMKEMAEEYRKITLDLGFNILILPKDQNIADYYADDFASTVMPEEYAETLSNSPIVTVNHLLPVLIQKIQWPEYQRSVLLTGVRGEVPLLHRGVSRKALLEPVSPGHIVLGHELWRSLGLSNGDTVRFMDHPMTVSKCHEQRGNVDDITVWINLNEAQRMLGKEGKISAMFALECRCKGTENMINLASIRKDVESVLPNTQIIEFMSEALTRAEARWKVVSLEKEEIRAEKEHFDKIMKERKILINLIIPVFCIGCLAMILMLFIKNVHERRSEIACFKATGIPDSRIAQLFIGRAFVIGFAGVTSGLVLGIAVSFAGSELVTGSPIRIDPVYIAGMTLVCPAVSVLCALISVHIANKQEPSSYLLEE